MMTDNLKKLDIAFMNVRTEKYYLLGSLTAVMTNLKPLVSVPQLSVTYLRVT